MNRNIKTRTLLKTMIVGAIVGAVSQNAHAVGEFDSAASIALLVAASATAATLVGGIIALSAGMDVWAKVRGFFKRAK